MKLPKIILVDVIPEEEIPSRYVAAAKACEGSIGGLVRYDLNTIWIRRDERWHIFHELTHWLAYQLFGGSCWVHAWLDKRWTHRPWLKEFRVKRSVK